MKGRLGCGRRSNVVGNVNPAQNRQLRSAEDQTGRLRVRLLGPVAIANDGRPVAIASKKARALLGYLALRRDTEVSRGVLTGLLWGERSESQARASLRQTLSELRGALSGSLRQSIVASRETVAFAPGTAWIDAEVLEFAADSGDDDALRNAAELIGGDLMEGLSVGEAGFEQWLAAERERFRGLASSIYARLMERAEHGGRPEEALSWGLKLLALDPLREQVHRALMRLYAMQGRHDAAIAQYERCRRELSGELGVAPEQETEDLVRSIRASRRDRTVKPWVSPSPGPEPGRGKRPALPERSSIAVLPFTNLGGNPEQQYLSDGITEDIITELSRYHSLLVIARNSCFQFRGPSFDIAAVREKLGVRFVVEGSVRKTGSRFHFTARLIDAATESHLWAERYDRDAENVFAVEDEITRTIAATLEGRVAAAGAEQSRRMPAKDWAAYDYFLQGREWAHRYDFVKAEPYFARAVELDPGFAQAHAWRANAWLTKYWLDRQAEHMEQALLSARRALSLDDADAWCHTMMGFVLTHHGRLDVAGPHFDRAIALNPTDVQIAMLRAWWLARVGRADEALEILDVAMRRDPFPPNWFWELRGIALMQARRYEDAIQALGRMSDLHVWDHAYLAACYARLNRFGEARTAAAEVLRMDPAFTASRYVQIEHFKSPADLEHLLNGMLKAGLPE